MLDTFSMFDNKSYDFSDEIQEEIIDGILDNNISGEPLLFYLIRTQDKDNLYLYLEKFGINQEYFNGEPPLWFSIYTGYGSPKSYQIVEMLLKYGADPNCCIKKKKDIYPTPLILSARLYPVYLDLLLKYGADPNKTNYDGFTALYYLIKNHDNSDAVKLLLEYGADPTIEDYDVGDSAWKIANYEIRKLFIDRVSHLNLFHD